VRVYVIFDAIKKLTVLKAKFWCHLPATHTAY